MDQFLVAIFDFFKVLERTEVADSECVRPANIWGGEQIYSIDDLSKWNFQA